MTEKNPNFNRFRIRRPRIRRAPEIETALGGLGMATMAAVAQDPDRAINATKWSPVGLSVIVDTASQIGVSEHATFVGLTILFGVSTMHGIWRLTHRD